MNDANASSSVEHDHVVQVFDGGITDQGTCYLVMELLQGETLKRRLARCGRLDPALAIHVGRQVAGALSAVHAVPIVHRDLKPDNIMIVPRDSDPDFVKVLDFGVAKLRVDSGAEGSVTGSLLGTPAYMAPEQWHVLPDLDGRADIYALGVTLYRCLTGASPFAANTLPEWMQAHLHQATPDPAAVAPMPAALSLLVRRMMAKERTDRPQTMAEVAEALCRIDRALGEEVSSVSILSEAPVGAAAGEAGQVSTLGGGIGERTSLMRRGGGPCPGA